MSTYRVEMIPKKSVIDDIIGYWEASGRPAGLENGQIVFDEVELFLIEDGLINMRKNGVWYMYNMSDFYRVKSIKLESAE